MFSSVQLVACQSYRAAWHSYPPVFDLTMNRVKPGSFAAGYGYHVTFTSMSPLSESALLITGGSRSWTDGSSTAATDGTAGATPDGAADGAGAGEVGAGVGEGVGAAVLPAFAGSVRPAPALPEGAPAAVAPDPFAAASERAVGLSAPVPAALR
jgi:hypothetical protein